MNVQLIAGFTDLFSRDMATLGWWPGDTPEEVLIGAMLTQNTSWKNVEKSLYVLKRNGLLNLKALADTPVDTITQCVRSSGTYRRKASYLRELAI